MVGTGGHVSIVWHAAIVCKTGTTGFASIWEYNRECLSSLWHNSEFQLWLLWRNWDTDRKTSAVEKRKASHCSRSSCVAWLAQCSYRTGRSRASRYLGQAGSAVCGHLWVQHQTAGGAGAWPLLHSECRSGPEIKERNLWQQYVSWFMSKSKVRNLISCIYKDACYGVKSLWVRISWVAIKKWKCYLWLTWHCLAISSSDWRNPTSWVSSTSLGDGPPSAAGWFLGAASGRSRFCRLNCPTDTPSALRGALNWRRGWGALGTGTAAAWSTSAPSGRKAPGPCCCCCCCCCWEPPSSSLCFFWRRWTFRAQFISKTFLETFHNVLWLYVYMWNMQD